MLIEHDGLRHQWYVVAEACDVDADAPVGVRLLGVDYVIWRSPAGELVAAPDRCPHRESPLSIGTVTEGCLTCAYHGWTFGAYGACTEIPSMPEGPIPARARVTSYDVTVRHGLVWVRLDGSVDTSVPACPAFDDPAMKVLAGEP